MGNFFGPSINDCCAHFRQHSHGFIPTGSNIRKPLSNPHVYSAESLGHPLMRNGAMCYLDEK